MSLLRNLLGSRSDKTTQAKPAGVRAPAHGAKHARPVDVRPQPGSAKRRIGLEAGGKTLSQADLVIGAADSLSSSASLTDQKVVNLADARDAALAARIAGTDSSASSPSDGRSVPTLSDAVVVDIASADEPGVSPAVAQPTSEVAVADSLPVVHDGHDHVKNLTALSGLPDGCVIASVSGPLAVSESLRKEIAVLRLGSSSAVVVVVTPKHFRGAPHLDLCDRIRKNGATIADEFTADTGLIVSLYGSATSSDGVTTDSSLAKELDGLITKALTLKASDIHINVRQAETTVMFRINGQLTPITNWNSQYAKEMIRSIHAIADQNTTEGTFSEHKAQSMMVSRNIGGQLVKLRVQTTQIYPYGIHFVGRVLRSGTNAKPIPFKQLGYARSHIEMLEFMMRSPWGVTIFAGETGSGKSTSLFTMMTDLAKWNPGSMLFTVEDPPEYNMEQFGIAQIPVPQKKDKSDNPFAEALRSLMRLDPDLAMVGEIRDADSAEAVVNLVRSGHKIVSTVHASGALSIIERLMTFNVDLSTMTSRSFIAGFIAQRLAPTLCEHCKEDYHDRIEFDVAGLHDRIASVTTDGDTLFVRGSGCKHCNGTGIGGQTVLAEVVIPDGKLLEILRSGDFNGAYEYWRSFRQPTIANIDGSMVGMTMLEHGILKMRAGLIAPDDLEHACGPLVGSGEADETIVGNEMSALLG